MWEDDLARLIFLGPPGSGKGTQAKRLSERYGFSHISSGNLLREEMNKKTAMGQQLESFLKSGSLAPDRLTCDIVFKRLESEVRERGFILDGFPRNLNQAQTLEDYLAHQRLAIDRVFYFDADEETLIKRLTARRHCNHCQRVYNIFTDPPQKEGLCDSCLNVLSLRSDDEPNTIRRRLLVYQDATIPLVDRFKELKILVRLNASRSIDEVMKEILEQLKPCLS